MNTLDPLRMDYCGYDPQRYAPGTETAARRGAAELEGIMALLPPDKDQRILEIGCGSGSLLLALGERGYRRCLGIDQDAGLVRHARTALGVDATIGRWRQHLDDTEAIYDTIIALDVLEHLPREELQPTLRVTRRRLAPEGRLILRVPNALCPLALPTLYGDLTHCTLFTPEIVTYLLRQAGFEGTVQVRETRPAGLWRRGLFAAVHRLIVRPMVGLAHFHFHGEFPSAITPNFVVCAQATDGGRQRS